MNKKYLPDPSNWTDSRLYFFLQVEGSKGLRVTKTKKKKVEVSIVQNKKALPPDVVDKDELKAHCNKLIKMIRQNKSKTIGKITIDTPDNGKYFTSEVGEGYKEIS
jgi:hypothetical protein